MAGARRDQYEAASITPAAKPRLLSKNFLYTEDSKSMYDGCFSALDVYYYLGSTHEKHQSRAGCC
jgi:hypothetical protein